MAERARKAIRNLSAKKIAETCRNVMLQDISTADELEAPTAHGHGQIPITDKVMQSQAAEFMKALADNLDIKFDDPGDFNTIAQVIHLAHDTLQGGLSKIRDIQDLSDYKYHYILVLG